METYYYPRFNFFEIIAEDIKYINLLTRKFQLALMALFSFIHHININCNPTNAINKQEKLNSPSFELFKYGEFYAYCFEALHELILLFTLSDVKRTGYFQFQILTHICTWLFNQCN